MDAGTNGVTVRCCPVQCNNFFPKQTSVLERQGQQYRINIIQIKTQSNRVLWKLFEKEKTIRIFREWGWHEDPEVIARLESEAIGDLCMKCIYENLIT